MLFTKLLFKNFKKLANNLGKVTSCRKGTPRRNELCLLEGKFPVTKNLKLDCGRVRNAAARGTQRGTSTIKALKANGLCMLLKRCKVKESTVCPNI